MPKKRIAYDSIVLIPRIVAETTAATPYTAIEYKYGCPAHVAEVEKKRLAMTPAMVKQFVETCDRRCRAAYACRAKWFEKIARSGTNWGRDQLYVWMSHWLDAYLTDPKGYVAHHSRPGCAVPAAAAP